MCSHDSLNKKVVKTFKSSMLLSSGVDAQIQSFQSRSFQRKSRRKIWELKHNHHCAIVGSCLTLSETRKLVAQFMVDVSDFSDYEFHTIAVQMASMNDNPGKKLQNFLDKKFKHSISQTKKMPLEQLRLKWHKDLNTSEIIATFWALITHPNVSHDLIQDMYGDIHMMSHLSGTSYRVNLKTMKQLQKDRTELRERCINWQSQYQQELIENQKLRSQLQHTQSNNYKLASSLAQMEKKIAQMIKENSQEQRQQLLSETDKLKQLIQHHENTNHQLNKQIKQLKNQLNNIQLTKQTPFYDTLEQHSNLNDEDIKQSILESTETTCELCPYDGEDIKAGLCGRCILYVGGRTGMTQHLRQLVEQKDGTFLYHDGGKERNTQELHSMLNQADVVVFPSNCVSHQAYWQLKKACKQKQKPYKTLNSTGISAFSSLLEELSH